MERDEQQADNPYQSPQASVGKQAAPAKRKLPQWVTYPVALAVGTAGGVALYFAIKVSRDSESHDARDPSASSTESSCPARLDRRKCKTGAPGDNRQRETGAGEGDEGVGEAD